MKGCHLEIYKLIIQKNAKFALFLPYCLINKKLCWLSYSEKIANFGALFQGIIFRGENERFSPKFSTFCRNVIINFL